MHHRVLKQSFSLLNTDHVELDSRWNFQNVMSPYHRIYLIGKGEGEISNGVSRMTLEAGYLYFIPAFTLCNFSCDHYLDQYFVQFFEYSVDGTSLYPNCRSFVRVEATERDQSGFERLLEINPDRGINRSAKPSVYEKEIYYREYQEINESQSLAVFLETQGILLQLMARFAESVFLQNGEAAVVSGKINDSVQFILKNSQFPLSIRLLAQRVNLNHEYFSRLFEKQMGTRPLSFINSKRVERAMNLIQTDSISFSEIADQTGFRNLSHFSATFKKITGLTPGAYRKKAMMSGMS